MIGDDDLEMLSLSNVPEVRLLARELLTARGRVAGLVVELERLHDELADVVDQLVEQEQA